VPLRDELDPGAFAFVMATGLVAIAAARAGLPLLSNALLALACLAWVALVGAIVPRLLVAGRSTTAARPRLRTFAVVTATTVIGSRFAQTGEQILATALWALAVTLWLLLFVRRRTTRDARGNSLLVVVATESLAVLAALLAAGRGGAPLLAVALAAWVIGLVLYPPVIIVIARAIRRSRRFDPDLWIVMGALAIATLAGSELLLATRARHALPELAAWLPDVNLVTWAGASALIAPLLLAELRTRSGWRYGGDRWSFVFPLRMYAVASGTLAQAEALPHCTRSDGRSSSSRSPPGRSSCSDSHAGQSRPSPPDRSGAGSGGGPTRCERLRDSLTDRFDTMCAFLACVEARGGESSFVVAGSSLEEVAIAVGCDTLDFPEHIVDQHCKQLLARISERVGRSESSLVCRHDAPDEPANEPAPARAGKLALECLAERVLRERLHEPSRDRFHAEMIDRQPDGPRPPCVRSAVRGRSRVRDMGSADTAFDAFFAGGPGALISGGVVVPAWSPDGRSLAYVDGPANDRRGWRVDLASGARRELVDAGAVRAAIERVVGEAPAGRGLPFAQVAFDRPEAIAVTVGSRPLRIDLSSGAVESRPAPAVAPRTFMREVPIVDPVPATEVPSPDGLYLLSTGGSNIVVRSTADGRQLPLTTEGDGEVVWRFDMSEPSYFSAARATNWSPDGGRVAAYRVDHRGVAHLPKLRHLKRIDEVAFHYFPTAGGVLERVTLHVLDVYGRPAVELDLGDTVDWYPVHAGWFSSGRELLVLRMSRDCHRVDVLVADAATGATRLLLSERSETFVRMQHDIYFARRLGVWLTPDDAHVIWASDRSGVTQLYQYDLAGKLIRQLTEFPGPVTDVVRMQDEHAYVAAHSDQDRPYDVHIHRVPLSGGRTVPLTEDAGVHEAQFSPDGATFVDTWSRPEQPPISVLRRADGALLAELSTADTSRLDDIGWVPPREFEVTATDGTTSLWGTMFFPVGFDPSQKYAAIELIYAGAQTAVAPHRFDAGSYSRQAQTLAQFGFVVVVLDTRGTPERSKRFHEFIYRDWAAYVDEHAEAIRQLGERESFLDTARVGVIGHSWGGYASLRCALDRPDLYRAAVTSAPGLNPYFAIVWECYLGGMPQHNRAAYEAADLFPLAANLQSELMIVAGTSDYYCWTDAVKLSEILIGAGKPHEFVVLPDQWHAYDASHERYYWHRAHDFFRRTLESAPVAIG
jgi:dipeptidyl aminopeptidase/acylaminoacyl peptidase